MEGVTAGPSPWLSELSAATDSVASKDTLPSHADVVIIGAGMTGCSLAYHLVNTSPPGKQAHPDSIVCIDGRGISGGASGRNGGIMWPCTDEPFEMRKYHLI